MAELVYAFDLKSNGVIHMSSSLIRGTRKVSNINLCCLWRDFRKNGSFLWLFFIKDE